MEGMHDALRTYQHTILQHILVSFCTARYEEKQQEPIEPSIYFIERFEISWGGVADIFVTWL